MAFCWAVFRGHSSVYRAEMYSSPSPEKETQHFKNDGGLGGKTKALHLTHGNGIRLHQTNVRAVVMDDTKALLWSFSGFIFAVDIQFCYTFAPCGWHFVSGSTFQEEALGANRAQGSYDLRKLGGVDGCGFVC